MSINLNNENTESKDSFELNLQDENLNHDKMLEQVIAEISVEKKEPPAQEETAQSNEVEIDPTGQETETTEPGEPENPEPFAPVGDETTEPQPEDGNQIVTADEARKTVDYLFALYNGLGVPLIAPRLQMNVDNVGFILTNNPKVTEKQVSDLLALFNQNNTQIAEALCITEDEAKMLRDPLIKILQLHNAKVDNPYVQLAIAVIIISINKRAVIKQIQAAQDARYERIVNDFKVQTENKTIIPEELEKPQREGFKFNPFAWLKGIFKRRKK